MRNEYSEGKPYSMDRTKKPEGSHLGMKSRNRLFRNMPIKLPVVSLLSAVAGIALFTLLPFTTVNAATIACGDSCQQAAVTTGVAAGANDLLAVSSGSGEEYLLQSNLGESHLGEGAVEALPAAVLGMSELLSALMVAAVLVLAAFNTRKGRGRRLVAGSGRS